MPAHIHLLLSEPPEMKLSGIFRAPPSIRFLFIGTQFRSTLPPHIQSPSCSCASLHSPWPARDGTCTRESAPCWAHQDTRSGIYPRP